MSTSPKSNLARIGSLQTPGFIRTYEKSSSSHFEKAARNRQMSSTRLMLSRLLQYARNILPAQIKIFSQELKTEETSSNDTMVTTRQNRASNSATTQDASLALESLPSNASSSGSKKRQRPKPAEDIISHTAQGNSISTTSTRKRQKLPLRERDEPHFERHTHIAVEIPVRDITQEDTPMWTVSEKNQSDKDTASTEDKSLTPEARRTDYQTNTAKTGHILDIDYEEALKETISPPEMSEKTRIKPARKTKAKSNPKVSSKSALRPVNAADTSSMKKPKHKRFDSEVPESEDLEQELKPDIDIENDMSSDDDAPEVVDTYDAQEKAVVTARSAAKAIEQQDATLRKKRKQRDEQFKKQAEATNRKRKYVDIGDANPAPIPLLDNSGEGFRHNIPSASKGNPESSKSRNMKTKTKMPEFLPAEFLEDEDVTTSGLISTFQQTTTHKPKKTKFLDPTPRKVKDRRKGSTVYRVMEAHGDRLLAPRAAKNARFLKEAWLNGQRGGRGMKKVVKGGFFRK